MELMHDSFTEMYEVEKIINCKTYHNKKYYLIKWLCYPINESTWEPKSNLKHLNYLIEEFEAEYPFSVDQNMYNIFCEEVKKKKRAKNKAKNVKNAQNDDKLTTKKRKIECFSDLELNDHYLDRLKTHLHINTYKKKTKDIKQSNDDLIIDLSSTMTQCEENMNNNSSEDLNMVISEEKANQSKLIMPKME